MSQSSGADQLDRHVPHSARPPDCARWFLEREQFPREKVCGDCLNPACWPVLRRLGLADLGRASPHGKLEGVEFIAIGGQMVHVDLPPGDESEIAIKRSLFDNLLFTRARELGAEIRDATVVSAIEKNSSHHWRLAAGETILEAAILVGADGRNSTVARLSNLLPRSERERVALQTHIPLPKKFGNRVVLQFLPEGYSGQAPVNENELNLCLVGRPPTIGSLRRWAERNFGIAVDHAWRTITPLTRAPVSAVHEIFSSSATPRAWSSHSPAKEFITRFVQANFPPTPS